MYDAGKRNTLITIRKCNYYLKIQLLSVLCIRNVWSDPFNDVYANNNPGRCFVSILRKYEY